MHPTSASMSGWRKSSRCESSMCVEVSPGDDAMAMRNSTVPDQHLVIPAGDWRVFIAGVRAGEFDPR
jgi:hypothetical protein